MRIGIDLGGSHIGVGLVDEKGNILVKKEKDLLNKDKLDISKQILQTIVEYILLILQEQQLLIQDIVSIGIASPGTVENGVIKKADNLEIKDFAIIEELQSHFSVPMYLKNDAKCAAIAEKEYGSLKGYDNAVFLTIGTGIGGAVIWNKELLVPKQFPGFEIGHMIIDKNGEDCKCGKKGCFEVYASMTALKKQITTCLNIDKEITGIQLLQWIQKYQDRKEVQQILQEYSNNLSIGISNLVNIFEPQAISIGGSFVYYQEILLEKLTKRLQENRLLFNNTVPKILLATMKNDAGIIGASRIKE